MEGEVGWGWAARMGKDGGSWEKVCGGAKERGGGLGLPLADTPGSFLRHGGG